MVALLTILRNASRAQSEGRANVEETRKQRSRGHYKGRGF
jgi:hypothetical protein